MTWYKMYPPGDSEKLSLSTYIIELVSKKKKPWDS